MAARRHSGTNEWQCTVLASRPGACSDEDTAFDILNKRYAVGEIGKDEPDQKKRGIVSQPTSSSQSIQEKSNDQGRLVDLFIRFGFMRAGCRL
jgi:hypothetical protein